MKIKALQKTTLIDYPGKTACTIFLFGCNFRCGFCHNPELVLKESGKDISELEVLDFLEKRKKYLDGICITGGEPLMTLNVDFLKRVKEKGYLIKLDTNGSYPEKLKRFIEKGLIDFVSMDIKTSKEKYSEIAGVVDIDKVEESIKMVSLLKDYEFRTTIVEGIHSSEDVEKMIKWVYELVGGKIKSFALQGFKNQGKFIDESYNQKKNTTEAYLKKLKLIVKPYCEKLEIRV